MLKHRLQIIVGLSVLVAAMAGGWALTGAAQRTVSIVPGLEGCWRLEGTSRQVGCLSDQFVAGAGDAAADTSGVGRDAAVIAYVREQERVAGAEPRLAGQCHPAMHELGRDEGRRAATEERPPTFPGGSTQLCTAGYVHGLSEGYLEATPDADVAAVYPELCADDAARSGCVHGIGHALVRGQEGAGTRPATTVGGAAVDRCEVLPESVRTSCHDGVYMELAMRTEPEPVAVREYVATCEGGGTEERQLACWAYLGLSLASNDVPVEDVPAMCGAASLPGQFPCIEGYGRDLGVERVASCGVRGAGLERDALRERCVDGAIGLQVGSGHVSAAEAREACRSLDDRGLTAYCSDAVRRYSAGRAAAERA